MRVGSGWGAGRGAHRQGRACRQGARYSMGTQGQGPTLVERGVPAAPPPAMTTRARVRTREVAAKKRGAAAPPAPAEAKHSKLAGIISDEQ